MTAPNLNSSNFTSEINVINGADYSATPYFTANSTGIYVNGVLVEASGGAVINAGASGVAGTVNIFPATASKGNVALTTSNNSGNTITGINVAAQTGARTYTIADAGASDTFTMNAAAQTLTNKTINGAIYSTDNAVASATLSLTSSATLTNVAGMVVTVVPGTYKFRVDAPCVSTANTGIKVGFKLTTAVITSGAISGKGFSAAASNMSAYSTTVSDQALWYDNATAVDLKLELDGTLVIGTGGTMQFQMGQHTSNSDTTSIYAGAYMSFTRIA